MVVAAGTGRPGGRGCNPGAARTPGDSHPPRRTAEAAAAGRGRSAAAGNSSSLPGTLGPIET